MNGIIIRGTVKGLWPNGLKDSKRGMNLLIVDETAIYKTSFWQEKADWAGDMLSIGDEIYLFGHVSGLWRDKNKQDTGIEISSPEILSVNSWKEIKDTLTQRFTGST